MICNCLRPKLISTTILPRRFYTLLYHVSLHRSKRQGKLLVVASSTKPVMVRHTICDNPFTGKPERLFRSGGNSDVKLHALGRLSLHHDLGARPGRRCGTIAPVVRS